MRVKSSTSSHLPLRSEPYITEADRPADRRKRDQTLRRSTDNGSSSSTARSELTEKRFR